MREVVEVATAPHQAVVQLQCSAGFLHRIPASGRRWAGPIGQCVGSLEVVIGGVGVGIGEQANRRGLWKPIVGIREHATETGDGTLAIETPDTKSICRTWQQCAAEVGSGDI